MSVKCGDYNCWDEGLDYCGRADGPSPQAKICKCKPGYTGVECRDKDVCYEFNKNDKCNQSKGYGKCRKETVGGKEIAKCVCERNKGVLGDEEVNGKFCNDLCWKLAPDKEWIKQDCNNHGTCVKETGKCTCDDGWTGDSCDTTICDALNCGSTPGWLRFTGMKEDPWQYNGTGIFDVCTDGECTCQIGGKQGYNNRGQKWGPNETGYAAPSNPYPFGGIATTKLSDGTCRPCPPDPPPDSPPGLQGAYMHEDNDPNSPHYGTSYCKACPRGTKNGPDSGKCNQCLPGYFTPGSGVPKIIPPDQMEKNYRTDCVRCPNGSTRSTNPEYIGPDEDRIRSKTCNKCSPGYYMGELYYDEYNKVPDCLKTCKDSTDGWGEPITACVNAFQGDECSSTCQVGVHWTKKQEQEYEAAREWCFNSPNNPEELLTPIPIPKEEQGKWWGAADETGEIRPGLTANCRSCSCGGGTTTDTHSGVDTNMKVPKKSGCSADDDDFKKDRIIAYYWANNSAEKSDEQIINDCTVNNWCDSGTSSYPKECDWKYKYTGKANYDPPISHKLSEVTSAWNTDELAPCPAGYHQDDHYSGVGFNKRICILDGYE